MLGIVFTSLYGQNLMCFSMNNKNNLFTKNCGLKAIVFYYEINISF